MKGYKMLNHTNPKLFKSILHEVVEKLKNGDSPQCEQIPIGITIDELVEFVDDVGKINNG